MPKSKRPKVVHTTRVHKGGREQKERLVEMVRETLEKYSSVYLFRTSNQRNQVLTSIREAWKDSKIVFGKNKVLQVALGKSVEDEQAENVHQLSQRVVGSCMLLFTNRPRSEVEEYFGSFSAIDYARMGMVSTENVDIAVGPLPQFPHSVEPYLRSLGLPCRLQKGVIVLEHAHRICAKGDRLTSQQARLLKAFEMKMARSTFRLDCVWHKGQFELVADDGTAIGMDEGDDLVEQRGAGDDDDDENNNDDDDDDDDDDEDDDEGNVRQMDVEGKGKEEEANVDDDQEEEDRLFGRDEDDMRAKSKKRNAKIQQKQQQQQKQQKQKQQKQQQPPQKKLLKGKRKSNNNNNNNNNEDDE